MFVDILTASDIYKKLAGPFTSNDDYKELKETKDFLLERNRIDSKYISALNACFDLADKLFIVDLHSPLKLKRQFYFKDEFKSIIKQYATDEQQDELKKQIKELDRRYKKELDTTVFLHNAIAIIVATIFLAVCIWGIFSFNSVSSYNTSTPSGTTVSSATCGYCHRNFTDENNIKSIRDTNLCSNCNSIRKQGNQIKEYAKVYHSNYYSN